MSILRNGLKLPFLDENVQGFWWKNNQNVYKHFDFAKDKIQEWAEHGYIEKVDYQPAHISPLSVAERITLTDETKLRLCLDASYLNDLMLSQSTKLPPLELSENLVDKDDWMTTLDLANCYFHVRLHVQDHGRVAFAFPKSSNKNEDRYDFYIIKILVYGLKPATLVINILTKPLIDHLLRRAIKTTIFIDDIRASNASLKGIENDTNEIKAVFRKAGWTFNDKKETPPSREVYYLGFHHNSEVQRYRAHDNKLNQIERRIEDLEGKKSVTPIEIASIVGKLVALELATSYVPRLCCHSYFIWIARVVQQRSHWYQPKTFPSKFIKQLKRALTFAREFSGKIRRKQHSYEELKRTNQAAHEKVVKLAGDGNELYGAHYDVNRPLKYRIVIFEDYEDSDLSSSLRELIVLHDCVKVNAPINKGKDLVYFTDSRVVYFWHLYGSANSRIAEILIQIKVKCLRNDVILEISWRPRSDERIALADTSSRTNTDDYALPLKRYKELCKIFKFTPEVDLFASTILHKTEFFYSRAPTLGSAGANALNFKWDQKSYAHPPKNLCNEVFKKIETEESLDLILVMLSTKHDTDFTKFLKNRNTFKDYVKMCIYFESRVYFPGKRASKFMISKHSWHALRIVKNGVKHNLKTKDIYHLT